MFRIIKACLLFYIYFEQKDTGKTSHRNVVVYVNRRGWIGEQLMELNSFKCELVASRYAKYKRTAYSKSVT